MSVTTEPNPRLMEQTRRHSHPQCVICGRPNRRGLCIDFRLAEDGTVEAETACLDECEGYPDILHGGIISSLLDGAMTNCLFARGVIAVTAELKVRFLHKVHSAAPVRVQARVTRNSPPLYMLEASIAQDGKIKAVGTGKFMEE